MSSSAVDSPLSGEGGQPAGDRGSSARVPLNWIKPGLRIWVTGHNRSLRRRLEPLLVGAVRPGTGPVDIALVVPETCEEWGYFAGKILPRLARGGEIGLVVADEEAERRQEDHPTPRPYHDAACSLGLRKKGIRAASSDLLVFRFAPAAQIDPSQA